MNDGWDELEGIEKLIAYDVDVLRYAGKTPEEILEILREENPYNGPRAED